MEHGLFAYIVRYSKRQQMLLVAMTLSALPLYYLSLDLPKTIINDAISGSDFPVDASFVVAGFSIDFGSLEQVPYLLILCFAFLSLVVINGCIKLVINIYRGVMGERMLRRLRLQLIDHIMKFPLSRFRNTSQGELVSMVNQETEPLGGFIGEAISLPLYQGGLLLTILIFMFVQDWILGLAAIALYPVQMWLIPKLQRQVNLLNRERTIHMRQVAERLGETVAGINEIHINDNSSYFKDVFSKALGKTFYIRVEIFKKKFFIKFLNNSIAQLTPFLFYLVGGLLVIRGDLSLGALVAVLAAYKDLSPPWKELLGWYQAQADARLRYVTLTDQFKIDAEDSEVEPVSKDWIKLAANSPIVANNVSLQRHDGITEVENVSLSVVPGEWIGLIGTGSSGKNGLAQLFARLVRPSSGRLLVAEMDATRIPKQLTGRSVSYVGHDSYLFATSIRDNLLLSLKYKSQSNHSDGHDASDYFQIDTTRYKNWFDEARLSGNSEVNVNANWVDHRSAGVQAFDLLPDRVRSVLRTVDLEDDLVRYALARKISVNKHPDLVERIIKAREMFKERVQTLNLDSIVEFLDPKEYNDNASLAENILFGASNHDMFSASGLAEHPVLRSLLEEFDLSETLDAAAVRAATTTVELFSDLPPGHEFFERYSFVDADDIVELKRILVLIDKNQSFDRLDVTDRVLIRSLPYRVISGRHRIGIFGSEEKKKIVKLRKAFNEQLDAESRKQIDFFSPTSFNALSTIGDNIIFGRIKYGRLGAEDKVYEIILEVLQNLDLMSEILEFGLAAPAGLAGSMLAMTQRQKLILARAMIKQPHVLVINEGLSALDMKETERILSNLKQEYPRMILFWVDSQARFSDFFDRTVYLQDGKLVKIEEAVAAEDSFDSPTDEFDQTIRSASSVDENEKISLCKSIPLFRFLDDPQLHLLASNCDALNIAKGDRLFSQGETGDALYIVVDGTASILISDGEIEKQVKICGVNEVIGELALLSNEPRLASVEAITDLAVLRLKREVFIDMLQTNGEIAYQILQVVVNRFVDSNRSVL
jgi:ABC-type bacteriocin/lantibiotic exporter with double-glycine peptidase domain